MEESKIWFWETRYGCIVYERNEDFGCKQIKVGLSEVVAAHKQIHDETRTELRRDSI